MNNFLHFADWGKTVTNADRNTVYINVVEPSEIADLIENTIKKMQEDGKESGEFKIEIPDNLSPEEVQNFISEVKRLLGGDSV